MVSMQPRRMVIEMVDDDMAAVLRRKSGAERLRIVDSLHGAAWQLIEYNILSRHPDSSTQQVRNAVAKRISGDSD